jgi:hypothetical protein
MSVYRANTTKSTIADSIMEQMHDEDNPDMNVSFKGYKHGGSGFKLQVMNIETLTDYTLSLWKTIIASQGLDSEINTNMVSGKIDIDCHIKQKKSRKRYFYSLMYLSITVGSLYTLWLRHQ